MHLFVSKNVTVERAVLQPEEATVVSPVLQPVACPRHLVPGPVHVLHPEKPAVDSWGLRTTMSQGKEAGGIGQ